jgi:hypothetical protein
MAMERIGEPIHYVRSMIVPTDESFLCVIEAGSQAVVRGGIRPGGPPVRADLGRDLGRGRKQSHTMKAHHRHQDCGRVGGDRRACAHRGCGGDPHDQRSDNFDRCSDPLNRTHPPSRCRRRRRDHGPSAPRARLPVGRCARRHRNTRGVPRDHRRRGQLCDAQAGVADQSAALRQRRPSPASKPRSKSSRDPTGSGTADGSPTSSSHGNATGNSFGRRPRPTPNSQALFIRALKANP